MKIKKETRDRFRSENSLPALMMLRNFEKNKRFSFVEAKKICLFLREYGRIKDLKHDCSDGCVTVIKTGSLSCDMKHVSYAAFVRMTFNWCSEILGEMGSFMAGTKRVEPLEIEYSGEARSVKDISLLIYHSFLDFSLKADSIKMKHCIVNSSYSYDNKKLNLIFRCE